MKADVFTWFKKGLTSDNEATRHAYQCMEYMFFSLTEKQVEKLAIVLRDSGYYKYTDEKVILDIGIEVYF